MGAVLTLALASLEGALDEDALGAGDDAAAVAFSLVADSGALLDVVLGVVGVVDGGGLNCGRIDTSGTESFGAAMFNGGAEGARFGLGAALDASGTGASCASCGRRVGASTCCAVRGKLGVTSGVADD